jgi:hypothetical protein
LSPMSLYANSLHKDYWNETDPSKQPVKIMASQLVCELFK